METISTDLNGADFIDMPVIGGKCKILTRTEYVGHDGKQWEWVKFTGPKGEKGELSRPLSLIES